MADYDGEALKRWFEQIKSDRGTWENLFEDIATFVLPSQRNFNAKISEGQERMDGVYDGTAIYAAKRLGANLHFLATNPATPWFNLKFRDKTLNDDQDAVDWLKEVTELYKDALNDSNFDSAIGEFWLTLPSFGSAPIACEEAKPEYGEDDPAKFNGFVFQSNHLARTYGVPAANGVMRDTFVEYELNARQAYERFGDKLSEKIKKAYADGDFSKKFSFIHAVYKRLDLPSMPDSIDIPADRRAFASAHIELDTGQMLEAGGYYEQPRFISRWHKRSDDDYGYGIGEETLPDVHTLNEAKALWFTVTEKLIDPPVFMESNNLIGQIELGSRGVTTVRDIDKVKFWEPPPSAFQVAELTFQDLKSDIREAWFWDRLDLPPSDAGDMTAYEFGKRLQRAMQLFGPTLARLYNEALNGLIQRGVNIMFRKQAFPPMPESLRALGTTKVDIEYDNPFARAQKSEVVDAMDMFVTDVMNMATAQTNLGLTDTVADLVDLDEVVTQKARKQNLPEGVLRQDAAVTQLRNKRAAQIQQQRDAELEATQAKTLSDASNADVGNLRQLVGGR